MSWAYALLSEAVINWQDKLLSGKVINISRVIKLSLSSHDNVPVNDPLALCLSFFFFCLGGVEEGNDCEQAASLWLEGAFFKLSRPLDSS